MGFSRPMATRFQNIADLAMDCASGCSTREKLIANNFTVLRFYIIMIFTKFTCKAL